MPSSISSVRALTSSLQLSPTSVLRKVTFDWRHGALLTRSLTSASAVAAFAFAVASWQAVCEERQFNRQAARLTAVQAVRAVSTAAILERRSPDVIQTLPVAPGVAQIVQTFQQAADKEGAHVLSLQAEDHLATTTALGHLDLALSVKAPYPSILIVIQQVLDRYPDATLRQILFTSAMPPTLAATNTAVPIATGFSGAQPAAESEAHLTLAFWRRPLGVDPEVQTVVEKPASRTAPDGMNTAASATPAASAGSSTSPLASTSLRGATALPPIIGASSKPRQ